MRRAFPILGARDGQLNPRRPRPEPRPMPLLVGGGLTVSHVEGHRHLEKKYGSRTRAGAPSPASRRVEQHERRSSRSRARAAGMVSRSMSPSCVEFQATQDPRSWPWGSAPSISHDSHRSSSQLRSTQKSTSTCRGRSVQPGSPGHRGSRSSAGRRARGAHGGGDVISHADDLTVAEHGRHVRVDSVVRAPHT